MRLDKKGAKQLEVCPELSVFTNGSPCHAQVHPAWFRRCYRRRRDDRLGCRTTSRCQGKSR
jgi:hypothetical protein